MLFILFFFFFQAEDGIRDYKVTGVQTCALPILTIVSDGVDRGVVRVPFLPQRGKRPWCVATDRVVRRAVAPDGLAGRLLEHPLAPPHVLAESRRAEGVDERVVPAVRRDLVAALDDRAHEARIPLGDHAEDEERAAGSVGVAE